MRKTFTFNGRNSSEFGLFITGAAVYDAAAYDYDFIDIPGRSGDLIIDNGRFHNITVTYPAFIVDPSRMADIRAWLLGPRGYCELTDDYNPSEYRLACFANGIKGDPFADASVNFDIVFTCKPQRWKYESGEPTRYIVLDLHSGDIAYQAAAIFNTGGRIYDLRESDPAEAFADVLTISSVSIGTITVSSDSKGAYIDMTAEGLVTTDGTEIVMQISNTGNDFLYEFDTGLGVFYASNEFTVINETPYTAYPVIEFVVTNGAWINYGLQAEVNGINVKAEPADEFTGILYVDSEIADSYYIETDGTKVNANSIVTITKDGTATTDFPRLIPGNNSVKFIRVTANPTNSYGGYVQMRPRWYTV